MSLSLSLRKRKMASEQSSSSLLQGLKDRFRILDSYHPYIHRDNPLPSWSAADVEQFIASDPLHGPIVSSLLFHFLISYLNSFIHLFVLSPCFLIISNPNPRSLGFNFTKFDFNNPNYLHLLLIYNPILTIWIKLFLWMRLL